MGVKNFVPTTSAIPVPKLYRYLSKSQVACRFIFDDLGRAATRLGITPARTEAQCISPSTRRTTDAFCPAIRKKENITRKPALSGVPNYCSSGGYKFDLNRSKGILVSASNCSLSCTDPSMSKVCSYHAKKKRPGKNVRPLPPVSFVK